MTKRNIEIENERQNYLKIRERINKSDIQRQGTIEVIYRQLERQKRRKKQANNTHTHTYMEIQILTEKTISSENQANLHKTASRNV